VRIVHDIIQHQKICLKLHFISKKTINQLKIQILIKLRTNKKKIQEKIWF
jgi:hypothetical protein